MLTPGGADVGAGPVRARPSARTSVPPGIEIAEARGTADCAALVEALNLVWDTGPDHTVIDLATVVAMSTSGNPVTLARLHGVVVGGSLGFFGPPGAPLHSHIVGVRTELAPPATGLALKLDQRARCLLLGVHRMTWTFDPLIARNAWFNLGKLGARPVGYFADHYGPMRDSVNRGQPSDRVLLGWDLRPDPPVVGAATSPGATPASAELGGHVALDNRSDSPGAWNPPAPDETGPVLVGIPPDVGRIRARDPAAGLAWRMALRRAFQELQPAGWRVTTFRRSGHYVFERPSAPRGGPGGAAS